MFIYCWFLLLSRKGVVLVSCFYKRLLGSGFVFVSIVYLFVVALYLFKQFSSPLMYYIDGPYYCVQVKHILLYGVPRYPDPPFSFYYLTVFSMVFGDVFTGVKIGSTLFILAGLYPLYYLVKGITRDRYTGYSIVLLYAFSPVLLRIGLDFIKNAMGLTILYVTLLLLYKSISIHRSRYLFCTVLGILLVGLTHVLDYAVLLLILTILLAIYIASYTLYREKIPLELVIAYVFSLAFLAIGFISISVMGGDPYKGVSLVREIIGGETSLDPRLFGIALYPLIASIISIYILYSRGFLRSLGGRILFSYSLSILILSIPLYPRSYYIRFLFQSQAMVPLALAPVIASIRDNTVKLCTTALLLALLLPMFIHHYIEAKPSIPLEEYREIKELVGMIREDQVIVVRDPRLRYWIETTTFNVVPRVEDVETGKQPVIVFDKPPPKPLPPIARPYYIGEYIRAYILPPKPPTPS